MHMKHKDTSPPFKSYIGWKLFILWNCIVGIALFNLDPLCKAEANVL